MRTRRIKKLDTIRTWVFVKEYMTGTPISEEVKKEGTALLIYISGKSRRHGQNSFKHGRGQGYHRGVLMRRRNRVKGIEFNRELSMRKKARREREAHTEQRRTIHDRSRTHAEVQRLFPGRRDLTLKYTITKKRNDHLWDKCIVLQE